MTDKQRQFDQLTAEIKACAICPTTGIGQPVIGEGPADAQVMFVGEAPGKQESISGRPFIGRSGQFLRKKINQIGLNDAEVFITSPVKYLPKTGTPTPAEVAHGAIHLSQQIDLIQPKLVVLMGRVAAEAALGRPAQVMKNHGTTSTKSDEPGRIYFLTIHPAAAIRFGSSKEVFEEDFKKLQTVLKDAKLAS